jgi:hypothetical protein
LTGIAEAVHAAFELRESGGSSEEREAGKEDQFTHVFSPG